MIGGSGRAVEPADGFRLERTKVCVTFTFEVGLKTGPKDDHYKGFAYAPPHLSGLFASDRRGAKPRSRGIGHGRAYT